MRSSVWLRLGRVSNLPTVWSNTLAGIAIASAASTAGATGNPLTPRHIVLLCVALSFLYVGGMYLNDGFDRKIDAVARPERPIPSGAVSAQTVFALGFGMLGIGVMLAGHVGLALTSSPMGAISALLLAAAIVLYDLWHKGNPWSPVLMGLCRVLVYVTAAVAVASTAALTPELTLAALALLGYLIGLTYIAKHEGGGSLVKLWPLVPLLAPVVYGAHAALTRGRADAGMLAVLVLVYVAGTLRLVLDPARRDIPGAVTRFIAGISLVDAIVITTAGGDRTAAYFALGAYAATRLFQRVIPGT
jgi:4-hydroxybenzoate polyprenyltransferase